MQDLGCLIPGGQPGGKVRGLHAHAPGSPPGPLGTKAKRTAMHRIALQGSDPGELAHVDDRDETMSEQGVKRGPVHRVDVAVALAFAYRIRPRPRIRSTSASVMSR